MKVINLSDLESSDIKYKISQFPDGQQDIVISNFTYNDISDTIQISSRFNSFKDLELIICITKALRRMGVKCIQLYIPYLLGSRSDRQFQEGGNSYLVDVIAPIINSLKFNQVTTIDVHSDVAAACIKNFKSKDNFSLVNWAITDIIKNYDRILNLVSPDSGALKKIYKLTDRLYYRDEIIICNKSRDIEGKLSKTGVGLSSNRVLSNDLAIIDDICDGGRSFNNIIIEMNRISQLTTTKQGRRFLIITHGIFSAGFEELSKWFDGIYCTNSIKDIGDFSGNDLVKTKVKQFKVI